MLATPPRTAGTPAPADVSRLGPREAERQAALLRVPAQSGEPAGRPVNDPVRPLPQAV